MRVFRNILVAMRLRTKLIGAFVLVVLTSVLICAVVLFAKAERSLRQSSIDYASDSAERIAQTAGHLFAELDAVVQYLYWDPDVRVVMRRYAREPAAPWTYEELQARQRAGDACARAVGFRNIPLLAVQDMQNQTRVAAQGGVAVSSGDFHRIVAGGGRAVVFGPRWQEDSIGGRYHVFTVGRLLRDLVRGEPLGVVVASADYGAVTDLLGAQKRRGGPPMTAVLVDAGGRLLAAGDRVDPVVAASIAKCADQFDRRRLFDFPGHLAAMSRIEGTPWHVVQLVPASPLYSGKSELLRDTLLTVGLSLAVALLLAMAFISHITEPLQALVARMATVRHGELSGNLPVTGRDELSQLAVRFNEMLGDVRSLLNRVREEQEQKRLAELKTLQLQINPHFLYHAVDSIRWLAVINQDGNIERMTSNLSRLLQISLESPHELVTVAKEIEYVRCFVEIERIRRVQPFSFEVELAPGVEDCLTLRLIVQPLVENALFHGMERCSGPGYIRVRGFIEGTDLLIEVADNGTGMDGETLNKLRAGSITQTSRGIGVRNVRERLRLCYGDGYDLSFSSEFGSGTVVRVRQPLHNAEEMGRC